MGWIQGPFKKDFSSLGLKDRTVMEKESVTGRTKPINPSRGVFGLKKEMISWNALRD